MRATRNRCKCGLRYDTETNKSRRKCPSCGTPRVRKTKQKHMQALDLPRATFVEANDGFDGCWVCRELGLPLDKPTVRDHEHVGDGRPRGILCIYHNRKLGPAYTPALVSAYAKYLQRAA